MKRRVLLAVPRPSRDLEGHALVAFHLSERFGCDVRLYHGGRLSDEVLSFEPDAVVLDYLGWSDRAAEALLAKRLGIRVIVLPTAGLFATVDEYIRAVGVLTGVSHCVDRYLAWGDYVARALTAGNVLAREAVAVVGCSRFDLYVEPFLRTVEPREDLLRRIGFERTQSPLVLWATSTNNFNGPGRTRRTYVERGVREGGLPEDELRSQLKDEETQFRAHSEAVLELARRNPEWNVLIKVHPLESASPYVRLTRGLPNVRVIQSGAIRDLLFHATSLLQRGCTTATEAWMLGKPVLELDIGEYLTSWAPPEHRAGNEVVRDVEAAEAAIRAYLAGEPISSDQVAARDRYLRDRYLCLDGHSSERVAEAILRVLQPAQYPDEERSRVRAATRAYAAAKATERLPLRSRVTAAVTDILRGLTGRKPSQAAALNGQVAPLFERYRVLLRQEGTPGSRQVRFQPVEVPTE